MTASRPDTCAICGESEPDRRLLHECFNCGRFYHLNPYSNQSGKDCGDVVLGDESGLFYYCNPCLAAIESEYRATPESASGSSGYAEPQGLPSRTPRPRSTRRYRRVDRL